MSSSGNSGTSGVGLVGLLTVAFVVLKLTHFIDWNWVWVLSPLWIAPLSFLLLIGAIAVIWAIAEAVKKP